MLHLGLVQLTNSFYTLSNEIQKYETRKSRRGNIRTYNGLSLIKYVFD